LGTQPKCSYLFATNHLSIRQPFRDFALHIGPGSVQGTKIAKYTLTKIKTKVVIIGRWQ
jgi:hypothetical protein